MAAYTVKDIKTQAFDSLKKIKNNSKTNYAKMYNKVVEPNKKIKNIIKDLNACD